MIALSPFVVGLLNSTYADSFNLVRIGDSYKTTHSTDLVFNGNTYVSDGTLMGVEPPKLSSTVDRQITKVSLADPSMSYGAVMHTMAGKIVETYIGFIDPVTEQPRLLANDIILAFKGVVDSAGYQFTVGNVSDVVLTLECSSPMGDLDMKKAYYSSRDFVNKYWPGDTSFDQVYEGSGQINLRWGKS